MAFEESVEKSLRRCLKAASANFSGLEFGPVQLLLACSGGIDSTALMLALCALRAKYPTLVLRAAHVNHGLRGQESDLDERFIEDLCSIYSVPLVVKKLSLQRLGPEARISEERLRKARYAALAEAATEIEATVGALGAPYIVTAHNLDDQIETMIFRLARGTSAKGLSGMVPVRAISQAEGSALLLRPLLNFARVDIESYLAEKGAAGRLDASNRSNDYNRNFLRNVVLPPLRERFPAFLTNMERLRRTIACDNDYLDSEASILLSRAGLGQNPEQALSTQVLAAAHPALKGRALSMYLQSKGVEVSFERIERALSLIDRAVGASQHFETRISLGENYGLFVSKNCILLKPDSYQDGDKNLGDEGIEALRESFKTCRLQVPEVSQGPRLIPIDWLQKDLIVTPLTASTDSRAYARDSLSMEVDLRAFLGVELDWRARRPQDHLQPLGMAQKVRLKKYLQVNKSFCAKAALLPDLAPAVAQRLWPVLALGSEILWVPGLGISEKLRHNGRPSHRLELRAQF